MSSGRGRPAVAAFGPTARLRDARTVLSWPGGMVFTTRSREMTKGSAMPSTNISISSRLVNRSPEIKHSRAWKEERVRREITTGWWPWWPGRVGPLAHTADRAGSRGTSTMMTSPLRATTRRTQTTRRGAAA